MAMSFKWFLFGATPEPTISSPSRPTCKRRLRHHHLRIQALPVHHRTEKKWCWTCNDSGQLKIPASCGKIFHENSLWLTTFQDHPDDGCLSMQPGPCILQSLRLPACLELFTRRDLYERRKKMVHFTMSHFSQN